MTDVVDLAAARAARTPEHRSASDALFAVVHLYRNSDGEFYYHVGDGEWKKDSVEFQMSLHQALKDASVIQADVLSEMATDEELCADGAKGPVAAMWFYHSSAGSVWISRRAGSPDFLPWLRRRWVELSRLVGACVEDLMRAEVGR